MSDYNIREAFEKIEDELIDSMMRNFSRHRAEETKEGYNWTQWQAEQLKSLEEYRKHNAKKFGKRFKTINGKVEEMQVRRQKFLKLSRTVSKPRKSRQHTAQPSFLR